MCLNAVQELGYDEIVTEFRMMQDSHQYWVEYALEQLNKVQKVATNFDGLKAHSWPDDELVRATSGQLRAKLEGMQQAISPESLSEKEATSDTEQSKIRKDIDSIREMI